MQSKQPWTPWPIKAKRASWVAAALAALLCTLAHAAPAAHKSLPVDAKRGELKDLQGRITALQRNLAKAEESRAEATDQLRDTESAISDLNRSLRQLGESRLSAEAALGDLDRQAQQLETLISAQQRQLGRLLYRQYLSGESNVLQLLLSGADPNQVGRDLHFLDLLARARAKLLRTLQETRAAKEQLRQAAQGKRQELASIEQRRNQERADLVTRQRQHQEILARLAHRIKGQRAEIDALKRNEQRLATLIAGLARIVARPPAAKTRVGGQAPADKSAVARNAEAQGAFAKQKGRLHLPLAGSIVSRYGAPRGEGGGTWKGVFIRAAEGSEVQALAAGQVVFADWLRGFGNLVIVDHGDNYLSVYGNNQSLLHQVGDSVKRGEALATVGSSGGNSQSGLYFELRHQGLTLDPLKWVVSK